MAAKAAEKSWWPFPSPIKYIVGNEICERFSFYGMRSILVVFMVEVLLFQQSQSTEVFHLFVAACYLTPLLGAYLADRWFGKYNVILYLSLFYCAGHATLAIWENSFGLYLGLGLIAFGAGGIKPCVSAYVGDQFTKKNQHLLRAIYDIFYFGINLGSVASSFATPILLQKYGPSIAFGIPGVLMGIATLVFWLGRKQFTNIPPSGADKDSVFVIWWTGLTSKGKKSFWERAKAKHPAKRVEESQAVWDLLKIFAFISVFWALFDQTGSTWVLQAQKMYQPEVDFWFFSTKILPSSMQAVNPAMVMILIPLFGFFIYPAINKFYNFTPLRRMGWGIALAAISYFQVAFMQFLIDQGQTLNILWQTVPYLTLTASEIMVSITGLEFGYTQSPKTTKSTVMSIWFLGVFFGNILVVGYSKLSVSLGFGTEVATTGTFTFFGILSLLTAILFALHTRNYKTKNYMND